MEKLMVQQFFFFFRADGTTKIDWWVPTSLVRKISYFRNSIVTDKQTNKKNKTKAFQNTNYRATKTIGQYLSLKQAFEYIHPAR